MKTNRFKTYVILAFVVLLAGSFTSPAGYNYVRELKGITDTWHRITLPDEMFAKINTNLSDLRIIGITAKGDTIEVPYLTEVDADKQLSVPVSYKVLNQTKNEKGYSYTLDTYIAQEVSKMTFKFAEQNFDWRVMLSGSQDMKDWYIIRDDYPFVSIKNEHTDVNSTAIYFPVAKFRYYRLSILSGATVRPNLLEAVIVNQKVTEGTYRQYTTSAVNTKEDKQYKETVISLSLPKIEPVSYISFTVKDKFDYKRRAVVEYLSDSVKTPKGWEYNYAAVAYFAISSNEKHEIKFNNVFTDRVRISITNNDNEPLHLDSFVVKGNLHNIYARFTQPATYYLLYGKENAPFPEYDLAEFKEHIPADVKELSLGAEQAIAKIPVPVVKPLFENKAWLWAIMALIIVMLGGFTLKMMKNR